MPDYIIQAIYFIGAILIILGFKKLCSPVTDKSGLGWASLGVLLTVLVTFFNPEINGNYLFMVGAILVGGVLAFLGTKNTTIVNTPQMIALYNSIGGAVVVALVALQLIKLVPMADTVKYIALFGVLLGSVSFSGSLIAYLKLKGKLQGTIELPMHQWLNALVFVVALTFGLAIILNGNEFETTSLLIFLGLTLALGILIALPIAKVDMPILVSVLNTFAGLAIGFAGYMLANPLILIAGILTAAAGMKLTQLISKSKNRPVLNVLFGSNEDFISSSPDSNNKIKELDTNDAAMLMAFAKNVIVVPGYGMAIAQAQHKLRDFSDQLRNNGVNVKFAIHPSAGRMPGHMNALLSDADISYDLIQDFDAINNSFASTDVVLVIGANDVVNPAARTELSTPLSGMPILNADKAKDVIIIKRGDGTGFSKMDNPLLYQENARLIYGDADSVLSNLISNLKSISS